MKKITVAGRDYWYDVFTGEMFFTDKYTQLVPAKWFDSAILYQQMLDVVRPITGVPLYYKNADGPIVSYVAVHSADKATVARTIDRPNQGMWGGSHVIANVEHRGTIQEMYRKWQEIEAEEYFTALGRTKANIIL